MSVNGTWTIHFQTPGGARQADLVLTGDGTALTGTYDGHEIKNGSTDGQAISFTTKITKPFPISIKCAATITGDTITGQAKAAVMTIPFEGHRTAA